MCLFSVTSSCLFWLQKIFFELDLLDHVNIFSNNGVEVFGALETKWRSLNFFKGIFWGFCVILIFFCVLQGIQNSGKG